MELEVVPETRISGHDTNRVIDVTIRFFPSIWFLVTIGLPAGNTDMKGRREHEGKKRSADRRRIDRCFCPVDGHDPIR